MAAVITVPLQTERRGTWRRKKEKGKEADEGVTGISEDKGNTITQLCS